ncbi:MAG: GSCFA domain-containing protein [Paludibacter sp.]|nr:GSCFA domain-containing protein [Paludibacter sp.]
MFQTKIEIHHSDLEISYHDRLMTLGSCFAENIGRKLTDAYFLTNVNPFGVLYNPVSIMNSIELLLNYKEFTQDDIFENRSLWQSFSHSSLFSNVSPELCLEKINSKYSNASEFLKNSKFLILTFGTAWIYEDRKSGTVVSNCHKLPSNEFIRRRLSVNEIVQSYSELINKLRTLFPDLQIIFSVSPIRHWKDGAHENNISKSTLLLAIDELQKKFSQVHYFPAYEIQMDELRDYRFYSADMLHPSEVAIDHIWERFSETYFTSETFKIKTQLERLRADLQHRPLFPESEEYLSFMKNIEKRKSTILSEYPYLSGRF